MSSYPDTHPCEIPVRKAEEPGLGRVRPDESAVADRAVSGPFKGARGPAEIGLNPPSPDFLGQVAPSGSHLENTLTEDRVAPVAWNGDDGIPLFKQRGPVHFVPK